MFTVYIYNLRGIQGGLADVLSISPAFLYMSKSSDGDLKVPYRNPLSWEMPFLLTRSKVELLTLGHKANHKHLLDFPNSCGNKQKKGPGWAFASNETLRVCVFPSKEKKSCVKFGRRNLVLALSFPWLILLASLCTPICNVCEHNRLSLWVVMWALMTVDS